MKTKPHTWSDEGARRLFEAVCDVPTTAGPHLTTEELDSYMDDALDDAASEYAAAHIDFCEECAVAAEARIAMLNVQATRAKHTSVQSVSATRGRGANQKLAPGTRLRFQPHHSRQPACVAPLERAARERWEDIVILEPEDRQFKAKVPKATIKDDVCPLVVTTAFRASYEQRCSDQWRVAIPLALAPRMTRIVTTSKSRLAGLRDYDLAKNLGGKCIAVADATSTFAARLVAAARQYRIQTECGTPRKRDSKTLYLIPMEFEEMSKALKEGRVDGFTTVEPFPHAAKALLTSQYAEATLGPGCTSTSTGFCCVVLAPREFIEGPNHRDAYDSLARTLFRSLWRVMLELSLEVNMGSGALSRTPPPGVAAALFQHFTEGLDLEHESDATLVEHFVTQFVPNVSPASLNADYEALSQFLSPREFRRLRAAGPPETLYETRRLRELCTEAITKELAVNGDTPRTAVRKLKERLAAATQ